MTVKVLNVGDITVTTEDAPEGTGEILTPNFAVVGLTYGRRMTDRVLIGLTGSFINEKVADASGDAASPSTSASSTTPAGGACGSGSA